MSDVEQLIRDRVQSFVNELSSLVREAALGAVNDALGGRAAPRGRGRPLGTRRGRSAGAKPSRARARGKGQKRSAAELQKLLASIRGYVQKNPGNGVEAMGRDLGIPTKELALPIKKLVASKELRTTGQKRATKYFPSSGRGGAGRGKRRAAKA